MDSDDMRTSIYTFKQKNMKTTKMIAICIEDQTGEEGPGGIFSVR